MGSEISSPANARLPARALSYAFAGGQGGSTLVSTGPAASRTSADGDIDVEPN